MAKQRDPQREQFWRTTINAWKESGQSVRRFCSQRHLSEASFHGWRRELAKRDRSVTPTLKFVPLQLRAESFLEVVLPDGLVVRAPAEVEASTVAALVAALRESPC
jgi:transposase